VLRYRPEATIIIASGFVFDVYGLCPNDSSSSAIDEACAPVTREITS
jgi:hypothetical protein